MELFKNIRLKIGSSILKKKMAASHRKLTYSSFSSVKKIGIVWDASKTEDFSQLTRFHQLLHERGIQVEIIGYYSGKTLPDMYTAVRYLTIIRRKDLNYLFIPVSNDVHSFINKDFDILIDMNFNKAFQLTYLTSLSKSGFKVGLSELYAFDTPFDLMIDLKGTVDIANYLTQAVQYLEMINNGKLISAK